MLRLLDRHDLLPATGLITAAVVLFHQPLRLVLDAARDVESLYHLDLVPALVVLCFAYGIHQTRRHLEYRMEAATAAGEARLHQARVQDLEFLVAFGRAVSAVQDRATLERVLWRELPHLVESRPFWVSLGHDGQQRVIATDDVRAEHSAAIDVVATRARDALSGTALGAAWIDLEGWRCLALDVGQEAVGVLGIAAAEQPLDDRTRRQVEAAAMLLAIGLRNLRTLRETRARTWSDPLTGCYNRAYAERALARELRRAHRAASPTSIILLDIDRFKATNDRYGHRAGDLVLLAVADAVGRLFRATDATCRYGGDEFLIILPDTPLAAATSLAQRLRADIAAHPASIEANVIPVRASLGVASARAGELDTAALIERADRALYDAKRAGRDRCHAARQETPATLMRSFFDRFPPSEKPPAPKPEPHAASSLTTTTASAPVSPWSA